jgi:hypothetical protein
MRSTPSEPSGLEDALDVGRRTRQLEGVRIARDHPVHDVDLFERGRDRLLSLKRCRHVDRPELGAHAAGPEPGNVGHGPRLVSADIERRQIERGDLFAHGPRIVVVPVDEGHLRVKGLGALQQRGVGLLWGKGHRQQQGKRERDSGRHGEPGCYSGARFLERHLRPA